MIYEGTITYVTVDKNGNDKNNKCNFIIEQAEMFGEVEKKLYEEFEGHPTLDVTSIKRSKLREVVNTRSTDKEKVFVVDVASTFIDEDTEEEKVTIYKMALYAENYDMAYKRITEYLKQGYSDLEIVSLKKTSFIDIL